jgi:hypothetical protein
MKLRKYALCRSSCQTKKKDNEKEQERPRCTARKKEAYASSSNSMADGGIL